MAEIEFVDTAAPPAPPPDVPATAPARTSPRRFRPSWVGLGSAALLAAAAALCVVSSFQDLYVVRFPAVLQSPDDSVDGWGRIHPATMLPGSHGARYGIVLVIVAGLFVAAALSFSIDRRRARLVGVAVGALASAVLAGVCAAAYLEADSALDTFRGRIRLEQLDTADRSPLSNAVDPHLGPLLLLALLGGLAALLALAVPAIASTLARRTRSGVVSAAVVPIEEHPEDEPLSG